ncbi:MAG: nucleoside deaminase [Anaerolineales bacterium]|nr:nucleoside deaminase [Chloroflexota bacterium]MBL6981636.1 nucleoside deaminase [Anaerolineales bacterium]
MDKFMELAIEEAQIGLNEGGIPIGSVLVKGDQVCGRGHNQRIQMNNPILHAEIHCLQEAGRVGSYRGSVLYSTLMPCFLCSGAIVQFGIKKVIVGESETFSGTREFLEGHGVEVIDLDLDSCKQMMNEFVANNPTLWKEDIGKL